LGFFRPEGLTLFIAQIDRALKARFFIAWCA
jgi:hypothetical protein